MRFHCNSCNKDFTTFSERDRGKKFAFSHFIVDKMKCPHCGASNRSSIPRKPLKQSRGRWQPKRRSVDTDDYTPQAIILHPLCQKRLSGDFRTGLEVVCDGCKSVFNCWTGNIDDGSLETDDPQFAVEKRKDDVAKAKEVVADKKRDDELKWLNDLRVRMGKLGFGYEFKKQTWYARFGGTIWKLTDNDVQAIRNATWGTPQTMVIKRTFDNKGVKSILAKSLLIFEMLIKERA